MIWVLCLFLCLKGTLGQNDNKPKFGLFFSPDLYYPSEERCCMHTSGDLKGYSSIQVKLETSAGTQTLYTVQPNMTAWHCPSFQVPKPSGQSEKIEVVVEGIEAEGTKVKLGSKTLTVREKITKMFIQTDKSFYKPGQLILFRLVSINQDMEVQSNNIPLISLQDPKGNILAQWKEVTPISGIAELSYQLAEEPVLGKYTIKANNAQRVIEVKTFVLPRFEAIIDAPNSISILEKEATISAYGKYTFGEKVQGNVTLKVCQKKQLSYWWHWGFPRVDIAENKDICYEESAKTDKTGKMKLSLDMKKFNLRSSDYARELNIDVVVQEEGTDETFSASKSINFESQLTKLSFKDTKTFFVAGVPYRGKLSLTTFDGQPIASEKVDITASYNGDRNKETFVTDSTGEVIFQLSTEKWGSNSVSLSATTDKTDEPYSSSEVSIRYGKANLHLNDIYVETKSYLYIHPVKSSAPCHQNVPVTVDYSLEKEDDNGNLEIFYMVILNGRIVQQGQKKVERSKNASPTGSVKFSLPIRDISPSGKILVFIVTETSTIAADTTTAQVTPCLKHAVSLTFSEEKVLPKTDVKMNLKANPGSMCAIRAVDKSVVMMKPEDELTKSKLQNLVTPERSYIRSDSLDYNICNKPWSNEISRTTIPWWWFSYPEKKMDFVNIIQDIEMFILTTWRVNAPVTCKMENFMHHGTRPGMTATTSFGLSEAPGVMEIFNYDFSEEDESNGIEEVSDSGPRVVFPETLIWDMQPIPSSGSSEMSLIVPDTITDWNAQMFCVGSDGLGLSSVANLRVFQPFFVDLRMPFSVRRGESLEVKALLFNFMSQEMMIQTSLEQSDQHILNSPHDQTICLGAGQKKTLSWQLTPTALGLVNISMNSKALNGQCGGQSTVIPEKGSRDAIIKPVLVEPEGTFVEQAHNTILTFEEGSFKLEKIFLELPKSYVVGSERAFVTFTGDILGSAVSNLDKLLAMSYGCGEQNMVQFAPNIFILNYLNCSNQLSAAILEKGKKFLDAGKQRQLTYQHTDGSYSAFGKSDPEGSTWLTAFVIKSFCQAQDITFIDQKHIQQGLDFLVKQQNDNGCFKAKGRLLNNGMKGGVDDEISLTAYVVVSLFECGKKPNDPVVKNALQCLKNEPAKNASPYKMALLAYAFTLGNCTTERSDIINLLDERANKADGMMYWSQETKVEKNSYWSKPKSVDIEITAYVLLTLSSHHNPSKEDIDKMAAITRWMCTQQNANGGYSSTQDTIVGLQAMSKFATITSGKSGDVVINVSSENGFRHRLIINNDNRILLQRVELPKVPEEYHLLGLGAGTIFMQVIQHYHSPPEVTEPAFSIAAQPQCVEDDKVAVFMEFWYTGSRPKTNMVILEFHILSGMDPVPKSLEDLRSDEDVKRVEFKDNVITIYVEAVTEEHQTLEIILKRSVRVTGLKPAFVKIYDYYITEERNTVCYLIECQ